MQLFTDEWEKIAPGQWVLDTIREGYQIEFTSAPPISSRWKETPTPTDPEQRQILESEIDTLLMKGAITRIPRSDDHHLVYSSFFLAPKKNGKWRPILNLKPINRRFIRPEPFRMETLRSITPLLR